MHEISLRSDRKGEGQQAGKECPDIVRSAGFEKTTPWPQSWKMIKTRTKNAPAEMPGAVIHQDTGACLIHEIPKQPIGPEVLRFASGFRRRGGLVLATISCRCAVAGRGVLGEDSRFFFIVSLAFSTRTSHP